LHDHAGVGRVEARGGGGLGLGRLQESRLQECGAEFCAGGGAGRGIGRRGRSAPRRDAFGVGPVVCVRGRGVAAAQRDDGQGACDLGVGLDAVGPREEVGRRAQVCGRARVETYLREVDERVRLPRVGA